MATKTLSVDEEAYRTLVRAKRHARESFSKVIKRATWNDGSPRCSDLLNRAAGEVSDDALAAMELAQTQDTMPEDKWKH